jgi:Integrase core domain.
MPENEGIASSLWSRPAICQLIKQKFNIDMPERSLTNYLKRWHMSLQRPTRKNYKQDATKVDEFKNRTYPEIVRKAIIEHAEIMFVDETGINNQEYRIRGYSPIGTAPTVCSVSHRETINMISGISIDGTCRYMCYEKSMTQQRFIDFMRLMTRAKNGHKILMITDNLKVHHSKRVEEWLSEHKDKIEIFFTPAYSPELNPDEYLNNVLKQNVHSGILPKTKDDIKKSI